MKTTNYITSIENYFENQPVIELVILFGSQVSGITNAESDIDIGIIFNELSMDTFFLQGKYSEELTSLLGQKVDVINLNSSEIVFVYRVLSEGKVIYEKHTGTKALFQENVVKRYFDLKPTYDQYYIELERRIKAGLFGKI